MAVYALENIASPQKPNKSDEPIAVYLNKNSFMY